MDEERRRTWDERYARREQTYDLRPSSPLPDAIDGVAPGLALDLACGAGRHSFYLAEHGWHVIAVDASSVGIELVRAEAARRGLGARIETRIADLEGAEFPLAPDRFDLVCDFYFLARERFPDIRAAVRRGGLFAAAIHIAAGHSYLLRPGELREIVEPWGWDILLYREGPSGEGGHHHATAELVARRPA